MGADGDDVGANDDNEADATTIIGEGGDDNVRKIWSICLKRWGIQWVSPNSIEVLMEWWQDWKFKKLKKTIWEVIPFAALWDFVES
ncbi:hypothetical protein Acr_08g0007950 [Actinidia rufa]|uniref:Uncharacterized protein n=1 Tax=Actinidia rufa TaxID=165716 RepID=A0A7J0F2H8_9ERIC|nr:hypothetical protein Acr_08g0007950 [Actinidia rufa]